MRNLGVTDIQIRALSVHKTAAVTALYTKATMRGRRAHRAAGLSGRAEGLHDLGFNWF